MFQRYPSGNRHVITVNPFVTELSELKGIEQGRVHNSPSRCMTYLLQLLAIPLCVGPGGVTDPVGVAEVEVVVAVVAGALTQ